MVRGLLVLGQVGGGEGTSSVGDGNKMILASVSEDCMIKIWAFPDQLQRATLAPDSKNNLEPYLTLRGHTGPLFAMSGRDNVLFTAGMEG